MARTSTILALIVLAACSAPQRWEHPTLAPEEWKADEAACRAEATREEDRDSARETGYAATARESRESREHPIRAQMDAFEATKRARALIERCMKAKGYVQARD
ncbi:MAG: hypothetical protein QGG17_04020 [Rhodospirillales bacterium]|jgi:hypothetical protein|nr:hypothetical protein [Rhodospirillales bacterium]MDP6804059.1 hypothetical protein [Rhodospirillales bacterium]